jgi:hypothetical protein
VLNILENFALQLPEKWSKEVIKTRGGILSSPAAAGEFFQIFNIPGKSCCRFWRWSRRERSADIPSDLGQVNNAGPAPESTQPSESKSSQPESIPGYNIRIQRWNRESRIDVTPKPFARHGRHGDQDGQAEQSIWRFKAAQRAACLTFPRTWPPQLPEKGGEQWEQPRRPAVLGI